MKHIKWYLNVHVEFVTEMVIGESDTSQPYFKSDVYTLLSKENLSQTALNEAFTKQFRSFDEYIARGSGWNLKHIINLEIHTFQYRPIGGSSYIQTPYSLKGSHFIANIRNNDQKCFAWSILAHLHPKAINPNRLQNYKQYEDELNMTGI